MIDEKALYKHIGDKLKDARLTYKPRMSQEKLAERLGMNRSSITNIELGIQKPPIHLIYNMCELFGLSIEDVLPTVKDVVVREKYSEKEIIEFGEKSHEVTPGIAKIIKKLN